MSAPAAVVPETIRLPANQRAFGKARLFDGLESVGYLTMDLDDLAHDFERAGRMAEEAARMYKSAAFKAQQRAREIERRLVDLTYAMRLEMVADIDRMVAENKRRFGGGS